MRVFELDGKRFVALGELMAGDVVKLIEADTSNCIIEQIDDIGGNRRVARVTVYDGSEYPDRLKVWLWKHSNIEIVSLVERPPEESPPAAATSVLGE